MMAAPRLLLALALLGLSAQVRGKEEALNIAGVYSSSHTSHCRCWGGPEHHCDCVTPGCSYVEKILMSEPDPEGFLNLTMSAGADDSCYTGKEGPWQTHVDQCGRIIGGAMWEAPGGGHADGPPQTFDPMALDQDMDLVFIGDVLGFNGGPAGFKHSVIMRSNTTICSTKSFLDGTCTVGTERFVCFDRFNFCTDGDCAGKNKDKVSPPDDAFFARLTTTGLNGTYELMADKSSKDCPSNISAYHFGTQLGLGWSQNDMHMTRMVDKSLSSERPDCIQFSTICDGLQFHFDTAYAGRIHQEGDNLRLSIHVIRAEEGNDLLGVDKCEYKAKDRAPQMVQIVVSQEGAVVGLSITLTIFILATVGLVFCCLSYRRRYIESKIDRAYDVFQS